MTPDFGGSRQDRISSLTLPTSRPKWTLFSYRGEAGKFGLFLGGKRLSSGLIRNRKLLFEVPVSLRVERSLRVFVLGGGDASDTKVGRGGIGSTAFPHSDGPTGCRGVNISGSATRDVFGKKEEVGGPGFRARRVVWRDSCACAARLGHRVGTFVTAPLRKSSGAEQRPFHKAPFLKTNKLSAGNALYVREHRDSDRTDVSLRMNVVLIREYIPSSYVGSPTQFGSLVLRRVSLMKTKTARG